MDSIQILHLTDCHLFAEENAELFGQNTRIALGAVVDDVIAAGTRPDAVVVTGDLSHDGTAQSYRRFQSMLAPLNCPVLCLPGNHDDPATLARTLSGKTRVTRFERFGEWAIVLLNTFKDGADSGFLSDDELRILSDSLSQKDRPYTVVALHHQPVKVGSKWIDSMMLENADAFFDVIDRFLNVRGIVFGHVHQAFQAEWNGIKLLGTPATSVQFAPKSDQFAIEAAAPGYRWLTLLPNGSIQTRVGMVHGFTLTANATDSR